MFKKKQDYSLLFEILENFSTNPKGESCSNKLLQHSQEQSVVKARGTRERERDGARIG
jgi:hypothetical protein